MKLISKATSAIIHPVQTASSVAGQTIGAAASGAKTAMRLLDRAAGQVLGGNSTDWSTPEPAPKPDVTPPAPTDVATAAPPAKKTARKTAQKPARKAASAKAATVAPALSVTEEEVLEEALRTPSGVPAADEGFNPDTAETDLHQPGTEPLMDPATVKSVKSEAEVLQRASDPDKG